MVRSSRAGGQEGALEWEVGEGRKGKAREVEEEEEALMDLQFSGMEPPAHAPIIGDSGGWFWA